MESKDTLILLVFISGRRVYVHVSVQYAFQMGYAVGQPRVFDTTQGCVCSAECKFCGDLSWYSVISLLIDLCGCCFLLKPIIGYVLS